MEIILTCIIVEHCTMLDDYMLKKFSRLIIPEKPEELSSFFEKDMRLQWA